jgi:hypothetical protein
MHLVALPTLQLPVVRSVGVSLHGLLQLGRHLHDLVKGPMLVAVLLGILELPQRNLVVVLHVHHQLVHLLLHRGHVTLEACHILYCVGVGAIVRLLS